MTQRKYPNHVLLAFYTGFGNVSDVLQMNNDMKRTKNVSGPFTHCEISFPESLDAWSCDNILSCTISAYNKYQNTGGHVVIHPKEFNRNDFTFLRFPCTRAQAHAIFKECIRLTNTKNFHDMNMQYGSVLPFGKWFIQMVGYGSKYRGNEGERGMFCSMLCVEALQAGGFLHGIQSDMTTPTDLYRYAIKRMGASLQSRVIGKMSGGTTFEKLINDNQRERRELELSRTAAKPVFEYTPTIQDVGEDVIDSMRKRNVSLGLRHDTEMHSLRKKNETKEFIDNSNSLAKSQRFRQREEERSYYS
jgi:hypothetical protein